MQLLFHLVYYHSTCFGHGHYTLLAKYIEYLLLPNYSVK